MSTFLCNPPKLTPLSGRAEVVPVANRGTRAASCSALRYAKRSRVGGPCWPTGASGLQGRPVAGSGAVLEAPALVAGLDDLAVVGETIEQGGGHLGIAEDGRPLAEG